VSDTDGQAPASRNASSHQTYPALVKGSDHGSSFFPQLFIGLGRLMRKKAFRRLLSLVIERRACRSPVPLDCVSCFETGDDSLSPQSCAHVRPLLSFFFTFVSNLAVALILTADHLAIFAFSNVAARWAVGSLSLHSQKCDERAYVTS
jgi:hypothetical protein